MISAVLILTAIALCPATALRVFNIIGWVYISFFVGAFLLFRCFA